MEEALKLLKNKVLSIFREEFEEILIDESGLFFVVESGFVVQL